MSRYNDYDPFVRVYNLFWGPYATRMYPILEHLVLRHLSGKAPVLDLCCGTGQLAARLTEDGYAVTGVDGSEPMIEVARATHPTPSSLCGTPARPSHCGVSKPRSRPSTASTI